MTVKAETFSSYPASVTFDKDGGYMQHSSDLTRIDVPADAIGSGVSVVIEIQRPDLDDALPPTTPGDTFTKVGPDGTTTYGRKITALSGGNDYLFLKPITIRLQYSDPGAGTDTVETAGAVDPSNWHPRDAAPFNDNVSVARAYLTLQTTRVGRPYSLGAPNSVYFVVGHKS
jgi:hypothetical protein